jgi:hypothetical protein
LKHLKNATDGWKKANRGQPITNAVAQELVQNVPLNIDLIAQRVVEQLAAEKFIAADAETKARATNLLCSDNGFKNLIKAAL